MTCTFFGHRDCNSSVMPKLDEAIEELITKQSVDTFYVGNHGRFDSYAVKALCDAKLSHPDIRFYIVLAYMPNKKDHMSDFETILPSGIEAVPKRFAISYRNKWMIERADYVLTHITRSYGGAAQFSAIAKRKNKTCINIV